MNCATDDTTRTAAQEDLDALCDAVRDSSLSVALFDLSARRILAISSLAREQFGVGNVDLTTFDYVERSSQPETVARLIATILEQQLKEWRWRSSLFAPDGTRRFGIAIGRVVGGFTDRAICLARYELSDSDDDLVDEYDAARLLEPSFQRAPVVNDARDERRLAERVTRLQRHLHRIAHEVEAAGVATILPMPEPSTVPGLGDLSPRQWEVVTRLVRGERVPTIARAMFLSPSTVRNHLATIYRKVGVSSQAELLELVHNAATPDATTP